jgi:uroporphyrin-III C-methyltransferase/precorrin-2 dehydrogenase/sirohydrochlorin ferrochelatase
VSGPALVSLVGAGPGDPELLTLRALRRLDAAELLLYDALVDPALLGLAPRARRFPVGKRAGRRGLAQQTIHSLMIGAARRGRRVVRLKSGDPFVLGRGGEEAIALARAGVPFEVVPGLTSAVAAPALFGIPVTHRGLAAGFVVVSGHAAAAYRPVLEAIPAGSLTLLVLMGLAERGRLAALLQARGWRPDTPAAIALGAGTAAGRCWRGTLADLARGEPTLTHELPGVIVIGQVVAVADSLARPAAPQAAPVDQNAIGTSSCRMS